MAMERRMRAESRNNRSGRSGQKAADGQNTEDIEEIAEIREAALRILDYADNTSRELVRKLQKKGYRYDQIELLVRNLVKAGLVDDVRYAESYVRVKTEAGKGPAWIRKKLIEKGIPRDQVENALLEVSDRGTERKLCLSKALEICGLKYDFEVDSHGDLVPVHDMSLEYEKIKIFEQTVRNEENRVIDYREKEKAKARMARRLSSAGFSPDAVIFAVKKMENL